MSLREGLAAAGYGATTLRCCVLLTVTPASPATHRPRNILLFRAGFKQHTPKVPVRFVTLDD
ncbi:MAG TPA: hypothetical protein VF483_13660 [Gemmatimonadaceae bacterium]